MNLAEWLQGDHEPSQRLKAAQSLCRALTERAGGAGLSLDPARIEVSAGGECRPEAGKGAPPGRYRAPEISDGRAATPQSQVFTAGVLCFEILGGRAFEPRGGPLLRDVRPDLPRDLCDAVQACLEMDAEWRPKDLTYVLGLMDGMGPATKAAAPSGRSSRPSSAPPAPARRSGRGGPRPRSWPLLAFALVALAASVASAIVRLRQPPPAPALPPPVPVAAVAPPTPAPSAEPSVAPVKPVAAEPSKAASATVASAVPAPSPSATPRSRPSPSPSVTAAAVAPVAVPTAATPVPAAPVATAPPVAAEPAGPAAVTSVSPPLLRRGATVLVDVHGVGLRSDHQVRVGRGREDARGVEVVRQRYVGATLLQVLLKIDAAASPGAYVLFVVDGTGQATNTRPFEIAR
jgi:hypothetical protein